MNTAISNLLTPEACVEAMQRFCREQVAARANGRGVALALPMSYPDGWQLQVQLEPAAPGWAIITDRGQTLTRLRENGLNLEAKETATLLDERKKMFELQQHGLELRKEIRLPLDGVDIQLFGESLVSIAHLVYRAEFTTREESPAERQLRQIFQQRNLQPVWNAMIDGHVEKAIRVNVLLQSRHPLACKVVRRSGPMLAYMEQWGWRWLDIKAQNPAMLRGMIYDPDSQEWDETTVGIANSVCDFFCPYFEIKVINEAIDRSLAA